MSIVLAIALLLGFILVHAIKLMRLYLILVEEDIPFSVFVCAYLRTTLVNLIIPYKLGEIYRIGVFSRTSRSLKTGFFSVLVDRFFDTLAIVFILLPFQLFIKGEVTTPVLLLFAFVICILFTYVVFPPTYRFLNRYIIVRRKSQRSLAALKILEVMNGWYEYVKKLVTGRYGILILFSFAAWIGEMLVLAGFYRLWGLDFTIGNFGMYIESIVSGGSFELKREYTVITVIVILIATIISLTANIVGRLCAKKEN